MHSVFGRRNLTIIATTMSSLGRSATSVGQLGHEQGVVRTTTGLLVISSSLGALDAFGTRHSPTMNINGSMIWSRARTRPIPPIHNTGKSQLITTNTSDSAAEPIAAPLHPSVVGFGAQYRDWLYKSESTSVARDVPARATPPLPQPDARTSSAFLEIQPKQEEGREEDPELKAKAKQVEASAKKKNQGLAAEAAAAADARRNGGDPGRGAAPMPDKRVRSTYDRVLCRCAPLQCNCSKTCTCYAKPDGQRSSFDPMAGRVGKFEEAARETPGKSAYPQDSKTRAFAKQARRHAAFQTFFQPEESFIEQGGSTTPLACGTASQASSRPLRGAVRSRGPPCEPDLDQRPASWLQLNMSMGSPFRTQESLLHFGSDPGFRRVHYAKYICDPNRCGEMKCACKKYCRCRGVAIPMFEGETDATTRGKPAPASDLGYDPWTPNLKRSYYFSTDPPRSGRDETAG